MKSKILVVEDDSNTLEFITDYLEANAFDVIQAKDGLEAVRMFDLYHKEIDLVLLDVMMPMLNGFEVCKHIRAHSNAVIFILSARSSVEDTLQGYDLGADEYISKPFNPQILVARINAMLSRVQDRHAESIRMKGILKLDKNKYEVFVEEKRIAMTAKEIAILQLLFDNEGIVFSRSKLIDAIWGYDAFAHDRTVDVYINTIRKKLGPASKYIKTVFGIGYKFEVD